MVSEVVTSPLSTALNVVDLNLTWDTTLGDPQIILLSLGVSCVRLTNVCQVFDTG